MDPVADSPEALGAQLAKDAGRDTGSPVRRRQRVKGPPPPSAKKQRPAEEEDQAATVDAEVVEEESVLEGVALPEDVREEERTRQEAEAAAAARRAERAAGAPAAAPGGAGPALLEEHARGVPGAALVVGGAAAAADLKLPAEDAAALLRAFQRLDRQPPVVKAASGLGALSQDDALNDLSIFRPALLAPAASEDPASFAAPAAPSVVEAVADRQWQFVSAAATADSAAGAAIGSLVGLAIGDATGHPLEFVAARSLSPEALLRRDGTPAFSGTRPHLKPSLEAPSGGGEAKMSFVSEFNKFRLKRGQWTDDCSMALAMADSLLVHRGYHGGDARARWHMWWAHGYCNAFRFDEMRGKSVGLGGNIALSLAELEDLPSADPDHIPPIFGSRNEDAGNGSIMRLAPVPIAYNRDIEAAERIAELQSRATHPGPDAAACCRFMTFFISQALASHRAGGRPGEDVRAFLTAQIDAFLAGHRAADSGLGRLRALLRCEPPGKTEANWDWKQEVLPIEAAIKARKASPDGTYNGYPVVPTYWGAYCLDGLAMALWSLWHSRCFDDALLLVVNLLGDADTTGAIACQMAGALYGLDGIKAGPLGAVCLTNLRQWDPYCEIGLRALLLYAVPPRPLGEYGQA